MSGSFFIKVFSFTINLFHMYGRNYGELRRPSDWPQTLPWSHLTRKHLGSDDHRSQPRTKAPVSSDSVEGSSSTKQVFRVLQGSLKYEETPLDIKSTYPFPHPRHLKQRSRGSLNGFKTDKETLGPLVGSTRGVMRFVLSLLIRVRKSRTFTRDHSHLYRHKQVGPLVQSVLQGKQVGFLLEGSRVQGLPDH